MKGPRPGLPLACWLLALAALTVLAVPAVPAAADGASTAGADGAPPEEAAEADAGGHDSRLTDERIPLQIEAVPERPRPLLELGNPFLGTGTLGRGFELPTGAVWQPSLLVFGTLRTALQSFDADAGEQTELATRLDLFANLQLSGSERLVLGFRPFDRDGRFTSYVFSSDLPGVEDGDFQDEVNGEITSLFFEGDFGEIFPNLSPDDSRPTDIGFSVGRQPLLFQEGLLIDDAVDAIGLTRNSLQPRHTSNFRATLLWAWGDVGRGSPAARREDERATLFGLLTSTDARRSTVDADLVYVDSDAAGGDLLTAGLSAVQRFGRINTAFRVLGSAAVDRVTPLATDGALLFSEISWAPHRTHDNAYVNVFWAIDEFSSAARGPEAGGPLGRAGISFAAVGLGRYGAPLDSRALDVAGGAVGYQRFFHGDRRQLLAELGARVGTGDGVADAVAATVRYQTALGRRFVVVIDGFARWRQALSPAAGDDRSVGGRAELVLKF